MHFVPETQKEISSLQKTQSNKKRLKCIRRWVWLRKRSVQRIVYAVASYLFCRTPFRARPDCAHHRISDASIIPTEKVLLLCHQARSYIANYTLQLFSAYIRRMLGNIGVNFYRNSTAAPCVCTAIELTQSRGHPPNSWNSLFIELFTQKQDQDASKIFLFQIDL